MKIKLNMITIILLFLVLFAISYLVIGNPIVFMNNKKLENSIKCIDSNVIRLNDIVPFDWDAVYTFEPYLSKEKIEEIIGFKSADIKENNINENMVHLLFVKNKKVVASILGNGDNLGYSLDSPSKVTFAEQAKFTVHVSNDIVILKYTT